MRIRVARVLGPVLILGAACPMVASRGEEVSATIEAVRRQYARWEAIDSLTIRYAIAYEHLSGQRMFGFDSADVTMKRRRGRFRLSLSAVVPYGPDRLNREAAWDGEVGTMNEPSAKGGGDFVVSPVASALLYHYDYYTQFLRYPAGLGRPPGLSAKAVDAARDELLPNALTAPGVVLEQDSGRTEDGADCVILRTHRGEVYWFEPARGHVLRKYERRDGSSGRPLVVMQYEDHRQVGDLWLPGKIVREDHAGLDDPAATPGAIRERRTLTVLEVSTNPIDDSEFRLTPPPGVKVHDAIRRAMFTSYPPRENPLFKAAQEMEALGRASDPLPGLWAAVATGAGLSLTLAGILLILRRGR